MNDPNADWVKIYFFTLLIDMQKPGLGEGWPWASWGHSEGRGGGVGSWFYPKQTPPGRLIFHNTASEIETQNLAKELWTESEKLSQQHYPRIILLNTVTYESAKQLRDQVKKLPKSGVHLSSFSVSDLKLCFTRTDSRVSFQKLTYKINKHSSDLVI